MDRDRTMPEPVAAGMPTAAEIGACSWLTEPELGVYSGEYARNGFQGGLQWYRCRTSGRFEAEQQIFSGRTIDVRSEEHTSELQSLMRISYAVFCLKKKKTNKQNI